MSSGFLVDAIALAQSASVLNATGRDLEDLAATIPEQPDAGRFSEAISTLTATLLAHTALLASTTTATADVLSGVTDAYTSHDQNIATSLGTHKIQE